MSHEMDAESRSLLGAEQNPKPKIVVIMGATGSGKSKLALDLASHFPIEIINADSMQVYKGLDVLTNKVPVHEQKGIPHHLLGIISPSVEFTAKDFRDSSTLLIDEILSRNHLPVIVGGTNYYIQALVSHFLLDDHVEDFQENCLLDLAGDDENEDTGLQPPTANCDYSYNRLKVIDPVAADRIHPNDQRKINHYLSLYSRFGVLPSKLFQGSTMQNWGRADNLKYDCCFICLDASLSVLDQYVNKRVDCMISAGLLDEVFDIYESNADYTRGLRQAIGVREFENYLRCQNSEQQPSPSCPQSFKGDIHQILDSTGANYTKCMLEEAIEKMKLNTRRLVRRQRRRISRLQMLFGWNIHSIDVTNCLLCVSDNLWAVNVVERAANIINCFLDEVSPLKSTLEEWENTKHVQKDHWTRYICQACGKELRGEHEWEQHKQGRSHRKRVSKMKRSGTLIESSHKQ